ncbi:MAG: hypothetical protein QOJ91_1328 [Sphingomonadales bacterium]|jgi:hypothetical protein|nr:hypothetical protein [Sphingomonadales bacterium]
MLRWLFGGRSRQATEVEEADEYVEESRYLPDVPVAPQPLPVTGEFATATASLAVFDPAAVDHRVDDDCDWWADPGDELEELRARNLLIVGLVDDGGYKVEVTAEQVADAPVFSLRAPSGIIFVGPGEAVSGGGYQPDGSASGYFISVDPGDYSVSVGWRGDFVHLGLVQGEAFENRAVEPVRL